TEQVVTVSRDGVKDGKTTIRFYSDMEGVPYISMADFHKVMLPKGSMKVSRQGNCYEVATSGGTALVDVKADRLTTSHIVSIFDLSSLLGPNIPCAVTYDNSPYVKPKERTLLPEVTTVTFDFKKYNIDLHDDGTDVYVPYATLADIYSDMNLHVTYYNDKRQELVVNTQLNLNGFDTIDEGRTERIYGRAEVTDDLAQYRYNELCFVFDYIYGYPGRDNELFKAGLEQCGFDAALDKAKAGTEVKKLLKSKDNVSFMLGMNGLQQLAEDGGHTRVTQNYNLKQLPAVSDRLDALANEHPAVQQLIQAYDKYTKDFADYSEKIKVLRKHYYGNKKYIVSADKSTAVITLDDMMYLDMDGWKAYYASEKTEADWETLLARNENLVATLLSGVRQARKDGVKNVILDVTLNTGGSSDLVVAILSLITRNETERQQVKLYSDYVISKQASTTTYVVDRNFDGKFDAEDAKVDYSDLNFMVLTSHRSFSCANLFPSVLKDSGFKVMGERSGGGSCAIQFQFTPDGMMYIISCYRLRMLNAKRENIDAGVPVDIPVPADKFYDIEYLSGKTK
ncbi:MAG: hypothetical protein K5764_10975, partial [Prevotella sp.]|nr:hypothetical protein [Prevotella sp.]